MTNYLKMPKKQQVIALLALGWSYRRIEAETGVHRETVAGYDPNRPPKPAKTFPGSDPRRRFAAAGYRDTIKEKLDAGLSLQRVWQDLVEEYSYGASYESVKRFARTLTHARRAVGVFHCAPGAEAQIDFFQGAPTLEAATGQWRRPWVFRMTLGHSRHGYEEAVWDQRLATFLRLHERAFRDLGGVPLVIRHDNLKAAVVRACFSDPDSHEVYLAFAAHWGFTPLPTQPRHVSGTRSTIASTRSTGTSSRWCPGCPGCPPALRRLFTRRPRSRGRLTRPSEDGGLDVVVEFCCRSASCRSRSAIRFACSSSCWRSRSFSPRSRSISCAWRSRRVSGGG